MKNILRNLVRPTLRSTENRLLPRCPATDKTADPDQVKEILQDGDVILIRISNIIFSKVADTSLSWESHVGIVFRNSDGSWSVAESAIPLSRFTSLEKFVARSENRRFLVRRFSGGLSGEEALRLRAAAQSRTGILYDFGFNYESRRLYCSKFVYDVYREATGKEVGHLETFRELLTTNPDAPLRFWRAWFFGSIPWDRKCVTTTSELRSGNLVTVFDSAAQN